MRKQIQIITTDPFSATNVLKRAKSLLVGPRQSSKSTILRHMTKSNLNSFIIVATRDQHDKCIGSGIKESQIILELKDIQNKRCDHLFIDDIENCMFILNSLPPHISENIRVASTSYLDFDWLSSSLGGDGV